MYPFLMIWIAVETLLIVLGVFFFNRYLRKGVDSALTPPDPLNEMYRWDELQNHDPDEFEQTLHSSVKNLPKS